MTNAKNGSNFAKGVWGFIVDIAKEINSKETLKSKLPSTIGNFQNDNTNGRQLSISGLNPKEIDNKLALLQFIFQKPLEALEYKNKGQEKVYLAIPISDEPVDIRGLEYIKYRFQAFYIVISIIQRINTDDTGEKNSSVAVVIAALKDVNAELIFEPPSDTMVAKVHNLIQSVVSGSCKLPVYSLKIKGKNFEKKISDSTFAINDNPKTLPWDKLLEWALSQLIGGLGETLQFLICEITKISQKVIVNIDKNKQFFSDLNELTNTDDLRACLLGRQEIIYKITNNVITFTGDITQKDVREKIKEGISTALWDYRINFSKQNIKPILKEIFSVLGKDYDESVLYYLVKFYDKESDLEEILMTFTEHIAPKNGVGLEQLPSVHDLKEKVERINCKVQSWREKVDVLNGKKETWGKWEIKYDTGYYFNLTFNKALDSKLLKFVAASNNLEQNLIEGGQGNVISMKFSITKDILNISSNLINKYNEITQAQENIQSALVTVCKSNIHIESYSPLQLNSSSDETAQIIADL